MGEGGDHERAARAAGAAERGARSTGSSSGRSSRRAPGRCGRSTSGRCTRRSSGSSATVSSSPRMPGARARRRATASRPTVADELDAWLRTPGRHVGTAPRRAGHQGAGGAAGPRRRRARGHPGPPPPRRRGDAALHAAEGRRTEDDVALAVVVDAQIFRLEAVVRWLDAADTRLAGRPAAVRLGGGATQLHRRPRCPPGRSCARQGVQAMTEPMLDVRAVSKTYGSGAAEVHALDGVDLTVDRRRAGGDHGAQRLGQEHAADHRRQPRGADERRGHDRRRAAVRHDAATTGRACAVARSATCSRTSTCWPASRRSRTWPCRSSSTARRRAPPARSRSPRSTTSGWRTGPTSFPDDLSGGERQRVAIARAVVGDRRLMLADEPTGALDTVSGEGVMRLLRAACQRGVAGVVVTHDAQLAAWADRIVFLRDGRVVDQTDPPDGPESLLRHRAPSREDPCGTRTAACAARRAVARWSWRLFRREWRQQVLVLVLITVAVAVTVAAASAAYNMAPSGEAEFGSAATAWWSTPRTRRAPPSRSSAIEEWFGTTEQIRVGTAPCPVRPRTSRSAQQDPSGPFGRRCSPCATAAIPSGPRRDRGHRRASPRRSASTVGSSLELGDRDVDGRRAWSRTPRTWPTSSPWSAPPRRSTGPTRSRCSSTPATTGSAPDPTAAATPQAFVECARGATEKATAVAGRVLGGGRRAAARRARRRGRVRRHGAAPPATDRPARGHRCDRPARAVLVMVANGAAVGVVAAVVGTAVGLLAWVRVGPDGRAGGRTPHRPVRRALVAGRGGDGAGGGDGHGGVVVAGTGGGPVAGDGRAVRAPARAPSGAPVGSWRRVRWWPLGSG